MSGYFTILFQTQPVLTIPEIIDGLVPAADLDQPIVLRKGDCYGEGDLWSWEALAQCGTDARDWSGYRFGCKYNPGHVGQCRLIDVRKARLYATTRYTVAHNAPARTPPLAWDDLDPTYVEDISEVIYCTGNAGEVVTYTVAVPAGGSIFWEWLGSNNAGIAWIVIRDVATGLEIAAARYDIPTSGGHRYLDQYKAGNEVYELYVSSLASGLPAGNYSVQITASNTNTPPSSGVHIYDRHVYSVNVAAAGDPAVDPFYYPTTPHPALVTNGQQEAAWYLRKGTSVNPADLEYIGGTHGNERAVSDLSLKLDGTEHAADLASHAVYYWTRWLGTISRWSFNVLGYNTIGVIADCISEAWTGAFDVSGYDAQVQRTALIDILVRQESIAMLLVLQTPLDGFEQIAIDSTPKVNYVVGHTTPATGYYIVPPPNLGGSWFDDQYAVLVQLFNPPTDYEATYPTADQHDELSVNNDGTSKLYHYWIWQVHPADIAIAAGDSVTMRAKWRTAYLAGGGFNAALQ